MKQLFLVRVFFAIGIAVSAAAQEKNPAFQASLTPEHAIHPKTQRIDGFTISVWGENPQTALSIGLVNGSMGESAGLSFGLVNYAESYVGLQWSFVNFTGQNMSGWQGGPIFGLLLSAVNFTGGDMRGVQLGAVNLAGKLSGVQVGAVNYSQRAESGLQVGVLNLIAENQYWFSQWPREVGPGMILVNWRF